MISVEEALRLIDEHVRPGRIVQQPLLESLGLALAKPISARAPNPRFDSSSVDGYAVSLSDFANGLPITLPVLDTIHAGASSRKQLKPGSTQRIFTGAAVPKFADAIMMQENVLASDHTATFHAIPVHHGNIRKQGGEFKTGDILFERGTVMTPSVAQALAACGYSQAPVHPCPTVSILVTGDELRPPGSRLRTGQIWDSNSIGLQAALSALGIKNIHIQHVSDNSSRTTTAVRKALERSDVIVATGGVSVGDRDYIKDAFARNGVHELFWRVRMKPGKPVYFGTKRQNGQTKYIFGLPGNPVSVMVTWQLFVRQAIFRMMGHINADAKLRGVLGQKIRKSDPRTEFVRAYRDEVSGRIIPLDTRDSHMTTGMAKADCLIVFPAEKEVLEADNEIEIIPIRWTIY